jgi:elongation factor G
LAKLAENDPGLVIDHEDLDGRVPVCATGELHVEIICDRLVREHHIYTECDRPRIMYLETIRRTANAEGTFVSRAGTSSQYACIVIRIEPNHSGYEFVDESPDGAIPRKFVDSAKRGIQDALNQGIVGGYETVNLKVTLCGGSYDERDSNEEAFESAGFMALKEALYQAKPVLLEPLMAVEILVSHDFIGSVLGDLALRRGQIEGMEDRAGDQAVRATVPLAELMGYAADLRSITQGRANCHIQFARYEPAPLPPSFGDDGVGVTADLPVKPKPRSGAEAVEPLPNNR